jgi:hypothetical protein
MYICRKLNDMKKDEIYLKIDSLEKQEQILTLLFNSGESFLAFSDVLQKVFIGLIGFSNQNKVWCEFYTDYNLKQITVNELETILTNK